jgi:hypothetical protein
VRKRTAAAAVLALALIGGGCGSSTGTATSTSTGATTTTTAAAGSTTTAATSTTTSAACGAFGSTERAAGEAALAAPPAPALLLNVQVQASACVDEVSFLFARGMPGWSVEYRDPPFAQDPSGEPVGVAGASHLVVRLEPAAGVDLTQAQPIQTYDGPDAVRPVAPSSVAEVRKLGDFESVTSWVVGLPEERPFEVVVRGEQLVVRVLAPAARATSCEVPELGTTIGYPLDWYAELSDTWACQYFDPQPFAVHPHTDDVRWAATVQAADAGAAAVVARVESGDAQVTKQATQVGAFPATVLDVVESGSGALPAGFRYRMYVVDTGDRALMIVGASSPPGAQAEANAAAVDLIASLVQR